MGCGAGFKGLFVCLFGAAAAFGAPDAAADLVPGRPVLKAAPPPPGWTFCRKPAPAAEPDKFPDVPGGDIFGLTNPTDVGNPGDCGLAFEYTGRSGKADGSYATGTLKTQFSATIADNLAVAVAPFVTHHHIRGVSGLDDLSQARFDGLSGELNYRFLERSATSRIAATFSMEPRWARVNPSSGTGIEGYAVELKLFADAVVVPDRLYSAFNLVYVLGTFKLDNDPLGVWSRFSGTNISGALAYQINDRLFVGAEAHFLSEFSGLALQRKVGEGLFLGPTMLVKLTSATALNIFWTPQIWGRTTGVAGRLDLENFERHQFRAKLATSF
jgi:hypothetical protein